MDEVVEEKRSLDTMVITFEMLLGGCGRINVVEKNQYTRYGRNSIVYGGTETDLRTFAQALVAKANELLLKSGDLSTAIIQEPLKAEEY